MQNKYGMIMSRITLKDISGGVMRAYYFFMKFMRSFLIGLGCGFAAVILIIAAALIIYTAIF